MSANGECAEGRVPTMVPDCGIRAARSGESVLFLRPAAPLLAVSLLGGRLNGGVTAAQEQAARRADARADQPQVARGVEQARVPLPPAGQERLDLLAQCHDRPLDLTLAP